MRPRKHESDPADAMQQVKIGGKIVLRLLLIAYDAQRERQEA